jgi:ribose 5-phosphate isomerase A
VAEIQPGMVVGVGTGKTCARAVLALANRVRDEGLVVHCVPTSHVTETLARSQRLNVLDFALVEKVDYLFDGADEIDGRGFMIKGGGAALTREKIVAAQSRQFICIADESKRVEVLGRFPVPVEVIPMAARQVSRRFAALGGQALLRLKDSQPLLTDNGQHILDVSGLQIHDPLAFESEVNQWAGVVTVGIFAHQRAAVCLLGTARGVETLAY